MRVTGRLVTGTGIAVALLLGVLAWDLTTIRRLAAVAEDLSEVSFRASTLSLEQDRLINRIDEFTRKYFVTRDPGYAGRLGQLQIAFERTLRRLESLQLSAAERVELGEL